MRRELFRLLVPGGVILAGTLWAVRSPAGRDWVAQAGPALPWLVLGAAILLAWRFQRSRVVALGLLLALPALAPLAGSGAGPGAGAMVLLTLCLAMTALALTRDRGLRSAVGAGQAVLPSIVVLVAAGVAEWSPALEAQVAGWPGPGFLTRWQALPAALSSLPPAAALGLLAALAALAVALVRHRGPVERGLLLTVPLAVWLYAGSVAPETVLLGAGLLLGVSVVETSYSLAYRDELTGLPTRRALKQALDGVGRPYALAMVDVDHFKKFNDRHGHDVGDQVLRMVAGQLSQCGGGGKAFRYGGEEFTLLFPRKDRQEAQPFLDEVRAEVEAATFRVRARTRPKSGKAKAAQKKTGKKSTKSKAPARGSRGLSVTVSIGVSDSERADTPEAVLKKADQALYRAKRAGRNRVAKG